MSMVLPRGACDAHCHVFGPADRFPFAPARTYTPADAPAEALFALHRRLGFDRAVLVQPACHGTDHAAMLDAIARSDGRYRGVALLSRDCTGADVEALDAAGICGARFNFVAHLGPPAEPDRVRRAAALAAPFGWHMAFHLGTADLPAILPLIDTIETPFVIDHLARVDARDGVAPTDLAALTDILARPGAWLKLSGADRASSGPPYGDVLPLIEALVAVRHDRLLWGTDWPHPNIKGPVPDERDLLALLGRAVPDEATRRAILVDNPRRLFGFPPIEDEAS